MIEHSTAKINHTDSEVIQAFVSAMREYHLAIPSGENLIPDGHWHRCDATNKDGWHGKSDGTYYLHLNRTIPFGGFYNWTTSFGVKKWTFEPEQSMTKRDREYYEREHKRLLKELAEERRKRAEEAHEEDLALWERAHKAKDDHLYLADKGVGAYKIKQYGSVLYVPMYRDKKLQHVQKIYRNGEKRFTKYASISGCYHHIPKAADDDGSTTCIGEGYATCASSHEASGHRVFVAFDAYNLVKVAKMVRERYPNTHIVILADDDWKTKGNPGLTWATKAAEAVDGFVAVPKFEKPRGKGDKDFNDMKRRHGGDAVKQVIDAAGTKETKDSPDDASQEQDSTEDRIAALAQLNRIDYDRQREAAAKELGIRVGTLDKEVENLRWQDDDDDDAPPPPTLEELAKSAAAIIACKDVLGLFAKEYGKLVTGDTAIGKILYLNAITRLFKKANHTAIKGTSSVGKSHERDTVLKFVPPEDVIELTSMSPKAFLYMPQGFEHKILSMGEAHEGKDQEFQNMLLRVLMSETELIHHFVEKDEHGELVTMTLRKKGPVAFMVTTTQNKLHPENETRMLSLESNDSQEQTKRVMDKIAQLEGRNQSELSIDFDPWHDHQRWLGAGEITVDIPFARTLASLIPPKAVRLRRDFAQLLRAIKAHALLHRGHRKRNSKGDIVARIKDDYEPVRVLLGDVMATAAEVKLHKSVVETVQAVTALHPVSGAEGGGVLARVIAAKLKLDQSTTSRRLKAAIAAGYVENLETMKGKAGRYRAKPLTDNDPKHEILPSCDELLAAVQKRQQGKRK